MTVSSIQCRREAKIKVKRIEQHSVEGKTAREKEQGRNEVFLFSCLLLLCVSFWW